MRVEITKTQEKAIEENAMYWRAKNIPCPKCGKKNIDGKVSLDGKYVAMICFDCHTEWNAYEEV